MKKLLLALLFCVSSVHAEVVATLPNKAGDYMYFTNTRCDDNKPYWKIVYSVMSGGTSIFGCWFYDSNMVHVRWNSGGTSAFSVNDLTIKAPKGSI